MDLRKLCLVFIFISLFFFTESLSAELSEYPEFLSDEIYAVVGGDAPIADLAATTDIVVNIKSEDPTVDLQTKLDTEIVNPYTVNRDMVLVGNPCDNELSAMIMEKDFPSCDEDLGIPEEAAIIKIYEDGFVEGYNVLLVAGWNETYTRIAASVLQKHDLLLSDISEDTIIVTSATSSGIEPFSDEEPVTTTTTATTTIPEICNCPDYCELGDAWQGECQWSSAIGKYVCVYHLIDCPDDDCVVSSGIARCPNVITTSTVSNTLTTSTTITTTIPNSDEVSIPKSFLVYSLIVICVVLGFLLIFVIATKKPSEKRL